MSQQINLFNPIFLEKKKYLSAVTLVQGWAAILVGLVLFGIYGEYQVRSLGAQAKNWGTQLQTVQAQLEKANAEFKPRQKSKALEEEVMQAEVELASQREVFTVVSKGGLGNTKGYSEYLRAFSRQISQGIWLTGISILGPGTEIDLYGRAMQPDLLPAYINRLKKEPVMQGKSFAMLDMKVPSVDIESKNEKGEIEKKRGAAPYIEFALQTKATTVNPEEANALESTRPRPAKEPGISLGSLVK